MGINPFGQNKSKEVFFIFIYIVFFEPLLYLNGITDKSCIYLYNKDKGREKRERKKYFFSTPTLCVMYLTLYIMCNVT